MITSIPPLRPVLLSMFLLLSVLLGADRTPTQASTVYHGNIQSHIYHRQGCRYFDCKACSAVFKTREEAEKSGFRPCKVCNP